MNCDLEIRGPPRINNPPPPAYPIDQNSNLCVSCQSLELSPRDFEPSYYAHGRQLFTRVPVQRLQANARCPLCQLFVKTLAAAGSLVASNDLTCSARIGGYNHQTNKHFATLRIWTDGKEKSSGGETEEGHILPVQSRQRKELGFLGRVVDTRAIDLNLIKKWLGKCLVDHGTSCSPDKKSEKLFKEHIQPDLILIDVIDRRIVYPVEPQARYLALSYVWGRKIMPMLQRRNFKPWSARNGLDSIWDDLPPTIRDAMITTQRLGERFLWIDSLCIVQDDPNLKNRLISRMDLIYAHAFLTLVAAGGDDAWAGLPGIREWSRNKSQPLAVVNKELTLICPVEHETLRDSVWASRGWTLQEWYFSKRRLIFHSGMIFFHCCRDTFREDLVLEDDVQFQIPEFDMGNGFRNTIERWEPYISISQVSELESRKRYFSVVHAYLRRRLTYQEDIMSAIAGIHDHFEEQADLGLWFGIPRESFGRDSWWRVLGTGFDQDQRLNGSVTRIERRLQYPSWSWVGWKYGASSNSAGSLSDEMIFRFNVSENFLHQDKEEKYMTAWLVWYRYLPGLGFRDLSKERPTDVSKQRWSTKEVVSNLITETKNHERGHSRSLSANGGQSVQQLKPSLSLKQVLDIGAEYKSQALKVQSAILVRTLTSRALLSHEGGSYHHKTPKEQQSSLTASLESLPILSKASSWLSPAGSLTRSKTDIGPRSLGIAKLDSEVYNQTIWREIDLPGTKLEAFAGRRVRVAIVSGPLRQFLEHTSQPKKVLRVLLLYELPVEKTRRYVLTERIGVGEISLESLDMQQWEETNVVIH